MEDCEDEYQVEFEGWAGVCDSAKTGCGSLVNLCDQLNDENSLKGNISDKTHYIVSKESIAAKKKIYRENNKELIADTNRIYRAKNKEHIADYKRDHYKKNREKILSKCKKYNEDNKEHISAVKKKYQEDNKEHISAKRKLKYSENKELTAAVQKIRRDKNKRYFNENSLVKKGSSLFCNDQPAIKETIPIKDNVGKRYILMSTINALEITKNKTVSVALKRFKL